MVSRRRQCTSGKRKVGGNVSSFFPLPKLSLIVNCPSSQKMEPKTKPYVLFCCGWEVQFKGNRNEKEVTEAGTTSPYAHWAT